MKAREPHNYPRIECPAFDPILSRASGVRAQEAAEKNARESDKTGRTGKHQEESRKLDKPRAEARLKRDLETRNIQQAGYQKEQRDAVAQAKREISDRAQERGAGR